MKIKMDMKKIVLILLLIYMMSVFMKVGGERRYTVRAATCPFRRVRACGMVGRCGHWERDGG